MCNTNKSSYDYGTANSIDFTAEVIKPKYPEIQRLIISYKQDGYNWISIEGKYLVTNCNHEYFDSICKYNSDGTDEEILSGKEHKDFIEKYDSIIAEAEAKIAKEIKISIEEALKGKFHKRQIHILDRKAYDTNSSLYTIVYQLSNKCIFCLRNEDMELTQLNTKPGLLVYATDQIGQKLGYEVILVNKRLGAVNTFKKYIKEQAEDDDSLDYEFVDIVTDKKVLKYFPEDEDYFYFEGHKIEKWSPSIGCADSVYIIR